MEDHPLLVHMAATIRRTIQEELRKLHMSKSLSDIWANEHEVMALCGKSRRTLLNAIASGKISPKDVRPNPIGKGYLIRKSAIVKD